jgi:PHD/YefM family antitoxin component YafN of YafNO toxin-antitoxin module
MLDGISFPVLDVSKAQDELPHLARQVASGKGRVELVDHQGAGDCVLISKAELESLEHAIELLSDADHVRLLTARLSSMLETADLVGAGS